MGPRGTDGRVPFEVAVDKAGFGLYSYILTSFAGFAIISFGCIAYGTTIIIPTSACELGTTTAQQGFLAAAPLVGLILGAIIWGYLGDVFGRRIPLTISLLSAAVINAIASISVSWVMMMILQFFASFLASGQFSLSMTLLSESVPMAKRNLVILLVTSIFILTQGIMAVIAMPIIPLTFSNYLPGIGIYWNSWRTLMVVYSVPSIISAMWLLAMKESPKFMFSKGREAEALDILAKIYSMNKRRSVEEYGITGLVADPSQKAVTSAKEQIVPLFKPPLLKSTLIMTCLFVFQQIGSFLVWLPTIANQFFQILETGEGSDLSLCKILDASLEAPPDPDLVPCALNTTALLMVLAVGAIQSVVNILISLVVNRFGRRNMVVFVVVVCGACGLITNVVPNAIGSVVLFIIFLNGFVVMGLYTAIAVALFPTSLRALAVALTTTGGRIGTFASIQILNLLLESNCTVGFYIFAALFTSSALVAMLLVDDRYLPGLQPVPLHEKSEASKL
ncbi:synaptic vesicle 2-related protein-like [Epargyreus clarus]|uniref:synaptic vesicle 2-related protein-like n=1 Tax=Epargyreus clarus TaxID=520877 RepID=UPI003C2B83F3